MGKTFTLTERTMLTTDGQAVPAGHPDGRSLLGVAGCKIPHGDAVKYGLVHDEGSNPVKRLLGNRSTRRKKEK